MATKQTHEIIRLIQHHYDAAVDNLRRALAQYLRDRTLPDPAHRADGSYCYPELIIRYAGVERDNVVNLAFGRLEKPGTFRTTLTRPALYSSYLESQLDLLVQQYEIEMEVRASRQEIPFPYVLEGADGLEMGDVKPAELMRYFPSTDLADIGDEAADGLLIGDGSGSPLTLFDALRTDYSLARLRHYTGTPTEHFQRYILFTNYHRYVDEFVGWACGQVGKGRYTALSGAGGLYVDQVTDDHAQLVADSTWRRHQMPGLSPDCRGWFWHYVGQYWRRTIEREKHLRPFGRVAARGLADDRPLRRTARNAADRRLCAGACLSARRQYSGSGFAARNPYSAHCRNPAGIGKRG